MFRRSYRRSMARHSAGLSTEAVLFANGGQQSSFGAGASHPDIAGALTSAHKTTGEATKPRPLSMSAESMVPFGPAGFSDDLMMLVLSMLDLVSLVAVARTSQHMRRVQMNPVVWRTALQTFFHDIPHGPRMPDVFEADVGETRCGLPTPIQDKVQAKSTLKEARGQRVVAVRRKFMKQVKSIVAKARPDAKGKRTALVVTSALPADDAHHPTKPSLLDLEGNPKQRRSTLQGKKAGPLALASMASENPLIRQQLALHGGHFFDARLQFAGLFMRRQLPRNIASAIPHWGVCPACDNSLVSCFDHSRCSCVCVRTRMPLTLVVLQSRARSSSSKLGRRQVPFTVESQAMIESLRGVFDLRIMVVATLSVDVLVQADVLIADVTLMTDALDLTELTLISDMVERGGGVIVAGSVARAAKRSVVETVLTHFGADPSVGTGVTSRPSPFQQLIWRPSISTKTSIKSTKRMEHNMREKGRHRVQNKLCDKGDDGEEEEGEGEVEERQVQDEYMYSQVVVSLTDGPFGRTTGPIVGSSVAADVFRINAHGVASGGIALPTTNIAGSVRASEATSRFLGMRKRNNSKKTNVHEPISHEHNDDANDHNNNNGLTFALYFGKSMGQQSSLSSQGQREGQLLVCADLDWTRDDRVGGCWAEVCNQRFMFNFCARTVADRRAQVQT